MTTDPIDDGVSTIVDQLLLAARVRTARATNPSAYPRYGGTPCLHSIARRAIADLLNHGWTPPPLALTPAQAAELRRQTRRRGGQG